jgi:2-amino-4-hydroxy-6-hydroxymethyldihydropteridine diphosphokinase
VLEAAVKALPDAGLSVEAVSPMVETAPLGPSRRRYANAAAVVATALGPDVLLDTLQAIELGFGRTRRGARWGARVLDLDIVLWDGGAWASRRLVIPHPEFRRRGFVLAPSAAIAGRWVDPLSNLSLFQLHTRLTRGKSLP